MRARPRPGTGAQKYGFDALDAALEAGRDGRRLARALALSDSLTASYAPVPTVDVEHLPPDVLGGAGVTRPAAKVSDSSPGTELAVDALHATSDEAGLKEAVREATARVERELIVRALEKTQGNVTHTARLLQISRKSLQTKMKELGLREDA